MIWFIAVEKNEYLYDLSHEVHEIAGYVLIALIALHIFGALKYHIIDKDDSLKRMLPQCPKKCCNTIQD